MNKAIISILAFISISGFTQNGNTINTHAFQFSDTLETVGIEDALGAKSERAQYRWLLRFSYDHVNDALIQIDQSRNNKLSEYIDNIQTITLGGSYLFSSRFLFGVTMPFHSVRLKPDGAVETGGELDRENILGDLKLHAKWRFTKDSSKWNIALIPRLFLPTGDEKYLISDDSLGWGARVAFDRAFGKLKIYSYLGYANASNSGFLTINRKQLLEAALGLSWRMRKKLFLNLEWLGDTGIDSYEKDQNKINITTGLSYKAEKLRAFAGFGFESLRSERSSELSFYTGIKIPFGAISTPTKKEVVKYIEKHLDLAREVLFKNDEAIILPVSFEKLNSAASTMIKYANYYQTVTIEGHTNSLGSSEYNKDLSQRRADSVRKYLIGRGVPADKLIAIGHGEERLKIRPEKTKADFAANRRVEFVIDQIIKLKRKVVK